MIDASALPALQARLGLRIASALSERSTALPHDVTERLRFAREQALAKARVLPQVATARTARTARTAAPVAWSAGGTMAFGGGAPWWQRALGVLPLVVLVSGLALIQQWSAHEQMMAAADIDAVLLADDLPPAAYSDPGFGEYLRSSTP
jgi:hypothetical protein